MSQKNSGSNREWCFLEECAETLLALRHILVPDTDYYPLERDSQLPSMKVEDIEEVLALLAELRREVEDRNASTSQGAWRKKHFIRKMEHLARLGVFQKNPELEKTLNRLIAPNGIRMPECWEDLPRWLMDPKMRRFLRRLEKRASAVSKRGSTTGSQLGYLPEDQCLHTLFQFVLRNSIKMCTMLDRPETLDRVLFNQLSSEVRRDISEETQGARTKTKTQLKTTKHFQRIAAFTFDGSKWIRVTTIHGESHEGVLLSADDHRLTLESLIRVRVPHEDVVSVMAVQRRDPLDAQEIRELRGGTDYQGFLKHQHKRSPQTRNDVRVIVKEDPNNPLVGQLIDVTPNHLEIDRRHQFSIRRGAVESAERMMEGNQEPKVTNLGDNAIHVSKDVVQLSADPQLAEIIIPHLKKESQALLILILGKGPTAVTKEYARDSSFQKQVKELEDECREVIAMIPEFAGEEPKWLAEGHGSRFLLGGSKQAEKLRSKDDLQSTTSQNHRPTVLDANGEIDRVFIPAPKISGVD